VARVLLYVCIIVMPLTGYVSVNFTRRPVSFFGLDLPVWGAPARPHDMLLSRRRLLACAGRQAMNPISHLLLASGLFLATHFVSSTPLRAKLSGALGAAYLAVYSTVAFATLGWMTWAYHRAPFFNLWYSVELRWVPLVAMPFAFVLFVCGLAARNPTMVGHERLLKAAEPARGILRVTRHPLMWAFALWAASHIVARGDSASVVFFGAFLVLALAGPWLIDRRKRAALGADWRHFAAVTSNVPFAAIAAGRNRFRPGEFAPWQLGVAVVLYAAFLVLHQALFGAHALYS